MINHITIESVTKRLIGLKNLFASECYNPDDPESVEEHWEIRAEIFRLKKLLETLPE